MALFAALFFLWARRRPRAAAARGFAVFALYYAALRFLLDALKPYGELRGGLTTFQIGALLLFGYGLFRLFRGGPAHARG